MSPQKFLLVSFPIPSHLNPALQLARALLRAGAQVTLSTGESARDRLSASQLPRGLEFVAFPDGSRDQSPPTKEIVTNDNIENSMANIEQLSVGFLRDLIVSEADEGCPFTCIIYTAVAPWIADLAREMGIPSVMIWLQPAALLDMYYYYFNGYSDEITNACNDRTGLVQLPSLPPFSACDIPTFITPTNNFPILRKMMHMQLEVLMKETNPKVLVNTFDALEEAPLKAIDKLTMVGIGPLLPLAFTGGDSTSNPSDSSDEYFQWLNTKPEASVVYVSFGSISVLQKEQMEEMARGLLKMGRPFLWVMRKDKGAATAPQEEADRVSCWEELQEKGKIIPWCSQYEVLSHPSVGCFLTHCGWNSTLESLACGVPMVAFPQWTDQLTNAKLIEDVWKTGVRVKPNEETRIVEGDEIMRCIEKVMDSGESGEEIRRNAGKWKVLAREAVEEGGSSHRNIASFLEEIAA
ncbi:hypothetical protein MLD38_020429 [Melastoma candidum]|uniref:Uncharacterized protein n=1 Tax=Melastoma candidum TaxID=119954 RepID=A0ACB9QD62_9MYRT|nr:hypothetical protein MLD38_020429 [Melastoma candidum]